VQGQRLSKFSSGGSRSPRNKTHLQHIDQRNQQPGSTVAGAGGSQSFFDARQRKPATYTTGDQSLNRVQRNTEIGRILVANEAMLKRL